MSDLASPPLPARPELAGDDAPCLYLDLLKKVLSRYLFGEAHRPLALRHGSARHWLYLPAERLLRRTGWEILRRIPFDAEARTEGRDWPIDAETMIGLKRLNNVQACITDVLERGVPGDLIETGVWRGGTIIFMRAVLKAYGAQDRTVWAADSFRGLPKPDASLHPDDAEDALWAQQSLAIGLEQVKDNFRRYGLLDDQVRFLPGWFRDTLPTAPIERLSVMRLDGDLYESTMTALESLYPRLSVGGYAIIDDYHAVRGCRRAVDDFRTRHRITDELQQADWSCVYWRRTG
jgi:O-methyltransferase